MSKVFENLQIGLDEDLEDKIAWLVPDYASYRILKKSVDARKKQKLHLNYSIEVFSKNENFHEPEFKLQPVVNSAQKPIIIGAGPAGLFAALRFVERGVPCVLLERGSPSEKRMLKITRFWRYGELDKNDNVCFGEGGAGLFSDGKLITRIKSPHIPYVMHWLVKFGAPEEIKYLANPHVGSDKIRRVIPVMRQHLLANNCEIHFNTEISDFLFDDNKITGVRASDGHEYHSENVILATGHSAEPIFHKLNEHNVHLEGKSFALGLRIEHPQKLIDQMQYREYAGHPKLGAANYRITHHNKKEDVGVYSFCMCPGGYVLSSGTEADTVVCNGMSNYNRNSPFANSAIVLSIDHEKSFSDTFGGLNFRKQVEQQAFQLVKNAGGSKEVPAQRLVDFFAQKEGPALPSSCPSKVVPTRLDNLFSSKMMEHFAVAFAEFEKRMPDFCGEQAQFHGVESRTSCPIRITRDKESLESISHQGLYPTGEGAGYAGGITSAACDGIRVAEKILEKVSGKKLQAQF